jgi:hypothetical protein
MQRQTSQWLIPISLAVGASVALWYYWVSMSPPEPQPVRITEPVAEAPDETAGPVHPVEQTVTVEAANPSLIPLPALNQSDEYFKLELASIFGNALEATLAESGMIERVVATVDNLPRTHVAEKIRPVSRLASPFLVDGQDGSGEYSMNSANYQRYDELVSLIGAADMAEVAELYVRFYPLFQSAYVDLGYPQGYFNDRLVEVIDHLLETPDVTGPIELVRPHVLYEYQDPALEGLSGGRKLLLRVGSEHAAIIKSSLRELRVQITAM